MKSYNQIKEQYPILIKALENARANEKLAHAFLIQSDMQENRNDFARALAKLSCCPNSKNGEPCQVCNICLAIESDNYADMAKITPEGKAYQIKVGDVTRPESNTIRGFTSSFYLTKISNANKKIGIIYEADRMNSEAQNALLKTLEEPPKDSLIILLTSNPKALLPTTISRCQSFSLCDSNIEFNFANQAKLYQSLWNAFNAGDSLIKLEQEANTIIDIANELRDEAARENEELFMPKIEQAKEFDERLAKRLTLQMNDNAVGLYIGKRQQFLSAIESFYSQLLLIANGAKVEDLGNKEMFENIDLNANISIEKALNAVKLAEKLIYSFKFFVNEALVIRNFVYNL